MKLLLSLNYKAFQITPFDLNLLLKQYDKEKKVKGFEICFDYKNKRERKYVEELIFISNKEDYIFQIHSNNYDLEFLDYINTLNYNKEINIVYHTNEEVDYQEMKKSSSIIFDKLLDYIEEKNYNINISVENLNSIRNTHRLDFNNLYEIICNNQNLKFTYDIGHNIFEYNSCFLNPELEKRLINVHIHNFYLDRDHQRLNDDDSNRNEWIKAINYLKFIDYQNTVVLEYDLYSLDGENIIEKMISYINQAVFISKYFD